MKQTHEVWHKERSHFVRTKVVEDGGKRGTKRRVKEVDGTE